MFFEKAFLNNLLPYLAKHKKIINKNKVTPMLEDYQANLLTFGLQFVVCATCFLRVLCHYSILNLLFN
jgi:hypothetical protein